MPVISPLQPLPVATHSGPPARATSRAVGADVTRVAVGDRAGALASRVRATVNTVLTASHMLCSAVIILKPDFRLNGGYAQYVRADADYIGLIPDGLSLEQAAHLTCRG